MHALAEGALLTAHCSLHREAERVNLEEFAIDVAAHRGGALRRGCRSSLLSQTGACCPPDARRETAIARRIEDGEGRIVRALVASPVAVHELATIGDELRAGTLRTRDITRNPADDDEEDAARARLIKLFAAVRDLDHALRSRAGSATKRKEASRALEQMRLFARRSRSRCRSPARSRTPLVRHQGGSHARQRFAGVSVRRIARRRSSSRPTCGSSWRSRRSTRGRGCSSAT